jgi:endonuclease/exonuclease/phosphatase (EEP) superfamily protein YafD
MQGIGYVAGLIALAVAALALGVRWVPLTHLVLLAMAAAAPYLALGAPAAVVVFAIQGCWALVAAAIAVTAASIAVQVPLYVSDPVPAGTTVRVMSSNLRYGRADPDAVAQLARDHADILAVQELTSDAAARLSAAGLDATFPYRALLDRDGPEGVGIWSRYPVVSSQPIDGFWLGLLIAVIQVPGTPKPVTVATMHMSAPWPDPIQGWRDDMACLVGALRGIAARADGPVVAAADLNATPDMREFRSLLTDGYRDAAEQAGAGRTRTHPADISVPPVFALDHIMTRGCTATSVRTLDVPGSDHRALSAAIVLPS